MTTVFYWIIKLVVEIVLKTNRIKRSFMAGNDRHLPGLARTSSNAYCLAQFSVTPLDVAFASYKNR